MSQRKLILSMQVTLDGFVSSPDNKGDWMITNDGDWSDLFMDLDNADIYLLGRKMYPEYSEYWQSVLRKPDSSPYEMKFAKLADQTQHIVFTKSDFKPDWKNTIVAHDPVAEILRLKKEQGKNIIVWGGAGFASGLINLGLIDEYRLALNPTIMAGGKSLFKKIEERQKLALISSKALDGGLVILRYK